MSFDGSATVHICLLYGRTLASLSTLFRWPHPVQWKCTECSLYSHSPGSACKDGNIPLYCRSSSTHRSVQAFETPASSTPSPVVVTTSAQRWDNRTSQKRPKTHTHHRTPPSLAHTISSSPTQTTSQIALPHLHLPPQHPLPPPSSPPPESTPSKTPYPLTSPRLSAASPTAPPPD